MNVSTMQARVFRRAYTTPEYTSALSLDDINVIKDDLWSSYVQSNTGRLNWESWTADTAVQSEYTIPQPSSTDIWAEVLESIAITYDDDTYVNTGLAKYVQCDEVNPQTLPKEWNWYLENQPKTSPIFYRADGSVFIAPMPLSSQIGTNRLKITGIRSIPDWDINTSESTILSSFPKHAIETIVYGWIWKAHEFEGRDANTILWAMNMYEAKKSDTIEKMSTQIHWAFTNNYPDE